jgi:hypothetical protein
MHIFLSGFFAQISYLEDKITKTSKIPLRGILREFRDISRNIFGFWEIFKILYFFNLKKILFEKKIK